MLNGRQPQAPLRPYCARHGRLARHRSGYALELAHAGAHVVAVARTVGGLEELDDRIRAAGSSATLVPLDVKDSDGIARLALALNERYQRLDVLVGNAGILGPLHRSVTSNRRTGTTSSQST